MSERLLKLKRLVSPIARQAGCDLRMPLPVWDDTGTTIGVAIECDKQMGPTVCRGNASFTIKITDTDEQIQDKARLAVGALRNEVLVTIRPKKAEKAA